VVSFGADRRAALAKYVKEREDWQAGRNPRDAETAPSAFSRMIHHETPGAPKEKTVSRRGAESQEFVEKVGNGKTIAQCV
jgi:hypothetical protein